MHRRTCGWPTANPVRTLHDAKSNSESDGIRHHLGGRLLWTSIGLRSKRFHVANLLWAHARRFRGEAVWSQTIEDRRTGNRRAALCFVQANSFGRHAIDIRAQLRRNIWRFAILAFASTECSSPSVKRESILDQSRTFLCCWPDGCVRFHQIVLLYEKERQRVRLSVWNKINIFIHFIYFHFLVRLPFGSPPRVGFFVSRSDSSSTLLRRRLPATKKTTVISFHLYRCEQSSVSFTK